MAAAQMPDGVTPQLGPDASGLAKGFATSAEGQSLADVRSLRDAVVNYELQTVQHTSKLDSIGG